MSSIEKSCVRLLEKGLEEDQWNWDWTSMGSVPAELVKTAKIIAKQDGVWSGGPVLRALESLVGLQIACKLSDGESYVRGTELCTLKGKVRDILGVERVALNLIQYACGISTQTRQFVDRAKDCPVLMTRKTLPGYKDLCLHSVLSGGGKPHRLNLAGGILIKENHIAAAGGVKAAVEGVRKTAPHGMKIEVEVTQLDELKEAISAKVDGVLLDNFEPAMVQGAVELIGKNREVFVEVSGGIDLDSIESYVLDGVDMISVGSLTHSVQAADLSLLVE